MSCDRILHLFLSNNHNENKFLNCFILDISIILRCLHSQIFLLHDFQLYIKSTSSYRKYYFQQYFYILFIFTRIHHILHRDTISNFVFFQFLYYAQIFYYFSYKDLIPKFKYLSR